MTFNEQVQKALDSLREVEDINARDAAYARIISDVGAFLGFLGEFDNTIAQWFDHEAVCAAINDDEAAYRLSDALMDFAHCTLNNVSAAGGNTYDPPAINIDEAATRIREGVPGVMVITA